MRYIYLLLFLLLPLCYAQAGQPNIKVKAKVVKYKVKLVLRMDSSQVEVRTLDSTRIAQFKKQSDFKYDDVASQPSLWRRFWRWFWHLFDNVDLKTKSSFLNFIGVFLKYLFIALGLAAVVFLVLRVLGVDVTGLFKRKPADAGVPYAETLENIHEINFDTDIDAAIAQHNYRLAVRLLYLKALKQLSDAGLIHWQLDKTNTAYIDELTNPQQREAFTVLTRQFEFVWYGEFTINGQAFQNIKTLFANFKQTLA
ncbi:DUF4129 domain-containing protein [Mucilaginibacter terrae]|uniref:DUF4129 domain-containing protein n=1 Tax=Mucilaginibacter terrae TaxID=1955052 RepID=UPI003625BF3D